MRRQRELLFAQSERERAARANQAAKAPRNAPAVEAPPARDNGDDEQDDESGKSPAPAGKTKLGKKVAVKAAAPRTSKIASRAKADEPDEPSGPEAKDAAEPAGKSAGNATAKSAGKLSSKGGKGGKTDEVGTCSVCRKPKPLQNGLVASHQKGLGKACAGSRKPPL